jgi:hypothetical protein
MKGLLELLKEGAGSIEYDPSKGITMDELSDTMMKLSNIKPQKPEYILSKHEAETLSMWQLFWIGENYRVLCSYEVSQIVKERASAEKLGKK